MKGTLVAVLIAILAASAFAAFYFFRPFLPISEQGPYVSDVSVCGFTYTEDGRLFMRLKIKGEADLSKPVTINGVHGWWSGRVSVRLPDGRQTELFEPGEYLYGFSLFTQIPGEMLLDAYLPTLDYENPCLEGVYNVTVFLMGPRKEVAVLLHKDLSLRMALEADVSPTVWEVWEENVTVHLKNTGDVPIIMRGVTMELTENGTTIGWVYAQTLESRILVVMPGESKTWNGTATMAYGFDEVLVEKTVPVDFVLDIAGAPRRFAVTLNVSFPVYLP